VMTLMILMAWAPSDCRQINERGCRDGSTIASDRRPGQPACKAAALCSAGRLYE
jgi:hypothetical protein